MMPIHCIGDSHSSVFSGNNEMQSIMASHDILPQFKSYRIGPATAYNLASKRGILDSIILPLPKGSSVMFCFGEVDCRAHLIHQANIQGRPLEEVIKECVDRYFSVFRHYQSQGYELLAWNVIPSSTAIMDFEVYPAYGTCQDRNKVARVFNGYLKELCDSHGMRLVSIFDRLVGTEDITDMSYYMDHIHLSIKVIPLVLEELKDLWQK